MRQPQLVLASASPRRRELLSQLGLKFSVVTPEVDEAQLPGENPSEHTLRLACAKAQKIARLHPEKWVLGADTTVVIDEMILGKPRDEAEAFDMLRRISGRWHAVITGYCLMHQDSGEMHADTVRSEVFIRALTPAQIMAYIATTEPMDKAGAYAIQGVGAALVQEVRGSYTNVVGLPLAEVAILWEKICGNEALIGC